jgi:hypothetical protein
MLTMISCYSLLKKSRMYMASIPFDTLKISPLGLIRRALPSLVTVRVVADIAHL